jgi:hypothetical protein
MATLTAEQITRLSNQNTESDTTETMKPFLDRYFPGAASFKPSLMPAGHGDGGYAAIFDIEVYGVNGETIKPASDAYREELETLNEELTFQDNSVVYLVAKSQQRVIVPNETFAGLFRHEIVRHETAYGTFTPFDDVAMKIAETFSKKQLKDIRQNDITSEALTNVDMAVAFALETKGMERAKDECLVTDVKLYDLLFGCDGVESLTIVLAKYAVVNAVKELKRRGS